MVRRFLVGTAAAVVATLAIVPAGSASTGEITRADASVDGSTARIAGFVDWTGCEHWVPPRPPQFPGPGYEGPSLPDDEERPYCGWTPYVTIAPGSNPAECADPVRRLPSLGEGVALVWSGGERRWIGNPAFDVSAVPLTGGLPQLVCLSLLETAPEGVLCAAVIGVDCPWFVMRDFFHVFDAAVIAAPASAPAPDTAPAPFETGPAIVQRPRCRKGKQGQAASAKRAKPCKKKQRKPKRHKAGAEN